MEYRVSGRDDAMTSAEDQHQHQQRVNGDCSHESGRPAVICHDLRQAIELLRAVPSAGPRILRPHRTSHKPPRAANVDAAARQPLRPVNQHSNRLSLPPQLPRSTDLVFDDLVLRQCVSLNDDVVQIEGPSDRVTVDQVPDRCKGDVSSYVLPWKIRRVKKHKLEQVLVDTATDGRHHHHHHHERTRSADDAATGLNHRRLTTADCRADSDDDNENRRQTASTESLDTVVERILDNAAMESERRRQKLKRRRREKEQAGVATSSGREQKNDRQNGDKQRPHSAVLSASSWSNHRRPTPSNEAKHRQQIGYSTKQEHHHHRHHQQQQPQQQKQQQQQSMRPEKTLEDLFEEAVESLHDDDDTVYSNESLLRHHERQQRRRIRSSENWERQVLDSELHDQCGRYHVQTFTDRDSNHVSRGFAVIGQHKTQKRPTADMDASRQEAALQRDAACRNEHVDVGYLQQRTVISARAAATFSDNSRPPTTTEENVDLGLEGELAANQHRRASRSSSVTWDSVSVDSLVLYDDEKTSVQAAAAGVYVSSTSSAERRQMDDEFVVKLRRLQDNWQQSKDCQADASATGGDSDDDDEVWVPMACHNIVSDTQNTESSLTTLENFTTCNDSHKPKTDDTMTSLVLADDPAVLSDCLTSQEVVINIKLPRRSRPVTSSTGTHQVPKVPFREIRLRREIRFTGDSVEPTSTSGVGDGVRYPTLMTSSHDDVQTDRGKWLQDVLEVSTTADGVALTPESLLASDDLTATCVGAEVEYQNTDASHSVELVPVSDSVTGARLTSHRVDVNRRDATRVVRLPATSASQLMYMTPTLAETVDSVRRAVLADAVQAGARSDGVSVSCHAVETLSHRGDNSPPARVHNIVVDCLPTTEHTTHCEADATEQQQDLTRTA